MKKNYGHRTWKCWGIYFNKENDRYESVEWWIDLHKPIDDDPWELEYFFKTQCKEIVIDGKHVAPGSVSIMDKAARRMTFTVRRNM